jgi:hypothetical protein
LKKKQQKRKKENGVWPGLMRGGSWAIAKLYYIHTNPTALTFTYTPVYT